MNSTPLARRLLAGAAGLTIGAFSGLALSVPVQAQESEDPTISVEGTAECWPYGEDNAMQWDILWDVDNLDSEHDGELASVSLTVEPESAADLVEMNGLVEGETIEAGLGAQGTIVLPHDTPVAALSIEVTVDWEIDGESYTDGGAASVELGECDEDLGEELPELGEWTFDCETVEITFTNPYQEELNFNFVPTTGEAVQLLVAANGTETIELASSEGLEIRTFVETDPFTEPIVISAEEWEQQGCDDGEGGELPVTGASTGLLALGAAALLVVGGGLFLVARRRRTTFSA